MFISGLFIGILVGFILQRGQFCLSGQLRQVAFKCNLTSFSPLLTAIAVQSVGFYLLAQAEIIRIPSSPMPIWATLFGALLFGIGMCVANRCVCGQLYCAGEGNDQYNPDLSFVCYYHGDNANGHTKILGSLSTRDTKHLSHYSSNTRQFWSPHFTAILLGLVSILGWVLSAGTGREFGLSFSIPIGNALQYLTLGQQRYLNWGTYLVIGTVPGSFIAAILAGNFRWKAVSTTDFGKSVASGLLMGVGAALTGGCTMANAVVSTAYFSWQGWIATLIMMVCVWCAFKFRKNPLESVC